MIQSTDSIDAVIVSGAVVDTNVFAAALRSGGGPSREVIRRSLMGHSADFSNALRLEYEDLPGRDVWTQETMDNDRRQVLAAFAEGPVDQDVLWMATQSSG